MCHRHNKSESSAAYKVRRPDWPDWPDWGADSGAKLLPVNDASYDVVGILRILFPFTVILYMLRFFFFSFYFFIQGKNMHVTAQPRTWSGRNARCEGYKPETATAQALSANSQECNAHRWNSLTSFLLGHRKRRNLVWLYLGFGPENPWSLKENRFCDVKPSLFLKYSDLRCTVKDMFSLQQLVRGPRDVSFSHWRQKLESCWATRAWRMFSHTSCTSQRPRVAVLAHKWALTMPVLGWFFFYKSCDHVLEDIINFWARLDIPVFHLWKIPRTAVTKWLYYSSWIRPSYSHFPLFKRKFQHNWTTGATLNRDKRTDVDVREVWWEDELQEQRIHSDIALMSWILFSVTFVSKYWVPCVL